MFIGHYNAWNEKNRICHCKFFFCRLTWEILWLLFWYFKILCNHPSRSYQMTKVTIKCRSVAKIFVLTWGQKHFRRYCSIMKISIVKICCYDTAYYLQKISVVERPFCPSFSYAPDQVIYSVLQVGYIMDQNLCLRYDLNQSLI